MNTERRKLISEIVSTFEDCKSRLESIRDDEQEAYDNLPESIQNGERGEAMQSAVSTLEDAIQNVEEAHDNLGMIE